MSKTVYIITGPTSTGKSLISYYLAKRIAGEIINCDSVQLYKYMDIGSAKPSEQEMSRVPHHLYSIIDPSETMTAAEYRKRALAAIDDIISRDKIPIVCGGTGLYINSVIYDMDFAANPADNARRDELEKLAEEQGVIYLHQYLQALDPDAAERIHPNNIRKVIRAIEAFECGKGIKPMSELKMNTEYDFKLFVIDMDREWLYDRINQRAQKIIDNGLVSEVEGLLQRGYDKNLSSMKGIGYKEIIPYLEGEYDLAEATEKMKRNTRHFAKRQLTWFKRYGNANHIDIRKGETVGEIVDRILSYR